MSEDWTLINSPRREYHNRTRDRHYGLKMKRTSSSIEQNDSITFNSKKGDLRQIHQRQVDQDLSQRIRNASLDELQLIINSTKDKKSLIHYAGIVSRLEKLDFVNSQSLIEEIYRKITKSIIYLKSDQKAVNIQALATIVRGLNLLGIKNNAAKEIIKFATTAIQSSHKSLNAIDFSILLYSIHGQDPNTCKALIETLTTKMKNCSNDFNAQQYAMILYGIHGQDPNTCKPLIETLTTKMKNCTHNFTCKQVAMALYGLLGQINTRELKNILIEKSTPIKIESVNAASLLCKSLRENFKNNISICQILFTFIQNNVGSWGDTDKQILIREINLAKFLNPFIVEPLDELLKQFTISENLENPSQSLAETIAKTFLSPHYDDLRSNIYIDGIEMDFYVPSQKLNIEIDNAFHETRSKEDALRDEYLSQKHGVNTLRINISHKQFNSTKEYKQHIENKISAALKSLVKN